MKFIYISFSISLILVCLFLGFRYNKIKDKLASNSVQLADYQNIVNQILTDNNYKNLDLSNCLEEYEQEVSGHYEKRILLKLKDNDSHSDFYGFVLELNQDNKVRSIYPYKP